MTDELKPGDKVEWHAAQGAVEGVVEQTLTADAGVKGHTAKAGKDAPHYKVRSDKTGAEAIHKPDALQKR